jgi:hypothetical protein
MVNPLNVADQLFRPTDITGATDAAVIAELAGNVADEIFAVGLGEQPLVESRAWGHRDHATGALKFSSASDGPFGAVRQFAGLHRKAQSAVSGWEAFQTLAPELLLREVSIGGL